jgi:hypothetical protein
MQLIADNIRAILPENGARFAQDPDFDPVPVVKLFTPDGAATWFIASAEPDEPDILFGLCDLEVGFPELRSVRLSEDCSAFPSSATLASAPPNPFPPIPARRRVIVA